MTEKLIIKETILYLKKGELVNAIRHSTGWFSKEREHPVWRLHEKIREYLFQNAFKRLSIKDRKALVKRFAHKDYFLEGVSRSYALEYFYLSSDFAFDEDKQKLYYYGRRTQTSRIPKCMVNYKKAIDEVVNECLGKDVSNLITVKGESNES